jgi:hypothetical protein
VHHLLKLLAVVACVGFASGASALTISGVSITNNTTIALVGTTTADRAAVQGSQTLAAGPTSFATRFWTTGAADRDTSPASGGTHSATTSMNYTITFNVTHTNGSLYELTVNTALLGALTAVNDGSLNGTSGAATVGAVAGGVTGGSLATGSLGLAGTSAAGAAGTPTGTAANLVVTRNGVATIQASGTGAAQIYTLTFTATFASSSPQGSAVSNPDEEAFRFGLSTATGTTATLTKAATADDYAGVGARNGLNDGHFVTLSGAVIPEPGTILSLGLGLAMLAGLRRRTA